jgi:hypothetical protein
MTFVVAAPEMVTAVARDLSNIGSTLDVANAAAAAPTTGDSGRGSVRRRRRFMSSLCRR